VRILTALALLAGVAAGFVNAEPARADENTISQDIARTGWDQNEPRLNPGTVSSSNFGLLYNTALQGQIYAQPLAVDGTLIVATENDYVYGLSEQTGAIEWTVDYGSPWPASTISCGDLSPNIGITSTPVFDPATDSVYLTAKVNDGPDAAHPHWYMEALDPATGAERPGWPVTIAGSPSNAPGIAFNPEIQLQRPGLLLLNGVIYAGFGSDCDYGNYRGYVVGVGASTAKQTTMWTDEAVSSNVGGGIWQAGSGLTSDGTNIYVATGNGISAPAGPGDKPPTALSDSVVKLAVGGDGSLSATDFFSPANAPTLDVNDLDLASGGPVLLPDGFGTASVPHVLVQEGKDGRVFLLNADNLGGREQGTGGTDDVVGTVGPIEGQWDHPAVWGGDGGYVYLVGNNGALRALKVGVAGTGLPTLTIAGASADEFGYTSGSPVVTSNGTTSGSAVVWVEWSSGPTGAGAQLRAYNAVPDGSGVLDLLYSVPIGTASKFGTPLTDGNKVVVGTRDGHILGYGSPANTPVTAPSVSFTNTTVGQSSNATATITANQAVTVTGASTTAPYGIGAATFPTTLAAGASMQIPLTFSPTAAGTSVGVLSVATSLGAVGLGLNGFGVAPGLSAAPASLTFQPQPTGSTNTQTIDVQNTTGQAETVNSFTLPAAPYSVTGLPAVGTVVQPGNSFVITVEYAPTVASTSDTARVTISSTSGALSIPLSGSAVVGAGNLVLGPATTDFGLVEQGTSSTMSFTVTNTGNLPVTVSKAKAPDSEFTAANPLPEGVVIGPGQAVTQSVTFAGTTAGTATDQYEITPADGQGAMYEHLTATVFTGRQSVPAPAAATWQANGKASFVTGGVQLTDSGANEAGTAFYTRPVPTTGLNAQFTAQFVKGTGADGLAFALADAAQAGPSALGSPGNDIGLGGIPGTYAVVLDSFWNAQAKSSNYVALMGPTATHTAPTYLATAAVPTSLETGTHSVLVSYAGGYLSVTVDGNALLHVALTLPRYAFAGFSGGTGGSADTHAVSAVSISVGQNQVPAVAAANWQVNGKAAFVAAGVRLTDTGTYESGTAYYQQAVPTAGFTAQFTAQFIKGTGANGLAFDVADAAKAGPTALGSPGSDFGLGGVSGYAVVLASYQNTQANSANYVALMGPTASYTAPTYLATAVVPSSLETGTHNVVVSYYSGNLAVTVDGTQLLSATVTLPPSAYIGFAGGTGSLADTHIVTNIGIEYN
jgi:hypothetical protein